MICACIKGATDFPGPRGHEKIFKPAALCPVHCLEDQPKPGYAYETLRYGDGTLVLGEYGHVPDMEAFDGDTSAAIIIRESWVLARREFKIINRDICRECDGDGEVVNDMGCLQQCSHCKGDGYEPDGEDWAVF